MFSGLLASLSIGCSRSILFKPYHFGYIAMKTSDPFLFYSLWSILPKLFCVAGSVICQIIISVSLLPPSLCFPNSSLVVPYSFSARGFFIHFLHGVSYLTDCFHTTARLSLSTWRVPVYLIAPFGTCLLPRRCFRRAARNDQAIIYNQ